MQVMVHGYEKKEFHRLKRCLRVSKTQDQHQLFINSFSIVVFVEETTQNLVNLKYQTSINIGYNANPTFSLMNNQSKKKRNQRLYPGHTKRYEASIFLVLTFGIYCLFSIENCLASLRIDRHFLSISFFAQPSSKFFLDGPQSMDFLLLALSQTLDFCSKPSPLSINYINVFQISLICPQCRV